MSQKLPKETQNKEAANALEKGNSNNKNESERENKKSKKRMSGGWRGQGEARVEQGLL